MDDMEVRASSLFTGWFTNDTAGKDKTGTSATAAGLTNSLHGSIKYTTQRQILGS